MPVTMPQIGPATAAMPAMSSRTCSTAKSEPTGFSAILQGMSEADDRGQVNAAPMARQGIHSAVTGTLKPTPKFASAATQCSAKAQPAVETAGLPTVAPTPSPLPVQMPQPVVLATPVVSDAADSSSQALTPTSLPGADSAAQPLSNVGTAPSQEQSSTVLSAANSWDAPPDQVEATVPDAAGDANAPAVSEVDGSAVAASASAPPAVASPFGTVSISATLNTAAPLAGESTTKVSNNAEPTVPGSSSVDAARAATVTQTSTMTQTSTSTSKSAPPLQVPATDSGSHQQTTVPSPHQTATEPSAVLGKATIKAPSTNEASSTPTHRLEENSPNLSKAKPAAKSELISAPGPTKPEFVAPVVSSPATQTPDNSSSSQTQATQSTVAAGEQIVDGISKGSTSQHQNNDGTGTRSQSENAGSQGSDDASQSFVAANLTSPVNLSTAASPAVTSQASSTSAVLQNTGLGNNATPLAASTDVAAKTTARSTQAPQVSDEVETHASSAPATYPFSPISSAKLVERLGESELRLGIRSGELGAVDIRTSMARNQFTAEISVERGELGRVLAAELPSLQNRLSEQRIPVASIVVQNQSGGNSGTSEQQKPRQEQPATSAAFGHSPQEAAVVPMAAALAANSSSGSRLDVHM